MNAQGVDALEKRLLAVQRASTKYRDALRYLANSQEEFGQALMECHSRDNDSAAALGELELALLRRHALRSGNRGFMATRFSGADGRVCSMLQRSSAPAWGLPAGTLFSRLPA